jgi:hypothetical protein
MQSLRRSSEVSLSLAAKLDAALWKAKDVLNVRLEIQDLAACGSHNLSIVFRV